MFFYLLRLLLSLRYRVTLNCARAQFNGLAQFPRRYPGGFLLLPNHVAYTDPLILLAWLWPHFRMRPVVMDYIYRFPLAHFFLKRLKAFSVPNFLTSVNQYKVKKADQAFVEMAAALRRGENVLFYPGGKVKFTAREALKGNAGIYNLLQICPEANIILIRTKGLWGSSFSKALPDFSYDLKSAVVRAGKMVLKNGLFFAPRRKVEIEILGEPSDFPRSGNRLELNQYMENWYNQGGGEPLQLVPQYFWDSAVPKGTQEATNLVKVEISPAVQSKLYTEIRQILNSPDLKISPEMRFGVDLKMDSLNIAEFVAFLGKTYHLGRVYPDQIETVEDALNLAERGRPLNPPPPSTVLGWPVEKNRPDWQFYPGKTLPEVFLNATTSLAPFAVCADEIAGVLTYKQLRRAVLVLAQVFRGLPEERVAILLPATVGAYLTYMALLFAGKVPVMLNWTLGAFYLEQMMQISGAQRVFTS